MSEDAPTPGELSRLIASMRDDQRNGFAAINARLDRLVSTELFSADQRRVDERLKALTDAISAEREARVSAIKDEKAGREKAIESEAKEREKVEDRVDKFKMSLRWVAATVIIPTALYISERVGV